MKITYEIPVTDPTRKKEFFLASVLDKFPKMVRWFLTVFKKEGLDFRRSSLNKTRTIVKELCYPTTERNSKYNCKGAVHFPHSHYYDTAITEAIQKWNSFLSWKKKSETGKRFPEIKTYAPVLDAQMFELDLENEWITLKTGRTKENVHIPIKIPNKSYYDNLNKDRISSIRIKERENHFVFLIIQSSDSPEPPSPRELGENPVIGIDLGERHLASSVTIRQGDKQPEITNVDFYDGKEIKKFEHKEDQIRKSLQKNGKSLRIPERGRKSSNKKENYCEKIAHNIAEKAQEREVVAGFIGDLSTPTPPNKDGLSRRLNNFPYSRLKKAIRRHLTKKGIYVETVDENGTSQECHKCSSEGDRHRGKFSCPNCKLEDYNADLNGAINHVGKGMKSLGKPEGLGAVP